MVSYFAVPLIAVRVPATSGEQMVSTNERAQCPSRAAPASGTHVEPVRKPRIASVECAVGYVSAQGQKSGLFLRFSELGTFILQFFYRKE